MLDSIQLEIEIVAWEHRRRLIGCKRASTQQTHGNCRELYNQQPAYTVPIPHAHHHSSEGKAGVDNDTKRWEPDQFGG
jgi:hypothetical protein